MSTTIHDVEALAILSTLIAALYAVLHGLRALRNNAKSIRWGFAKSKLPPGPVGVPVLGMSSDNLYATCAHIVPRMLSISH